MGRDRERPPEQLRLHDGRAPAPPGDAVLLPAPGGQDRFPPEGQCRVYRSENAGASWEPLSDGLPTDPYYAAVLRDAMATDRADPAGIYFGTRLGEVYASRDDGERWAMIASHLPDVMSVRVAAID